MNIHASIFSLSFFTHVVALTVLGYSIKCSWLTRAHWAILQPTKTPLSSLQQFLCMARRSIHRAQKHRCIFVYSRLNLAITLRDVFCFIVVPAMLSFMGVAYCAIWHLLLLLMMMMIGLVLTCGHRWGFGVMVISACWLKWCDSRCADAGDPSAHDPGS